MPRAIWRPYRCRHFSKDVGSLSSTALEQAFDGLLASNNLIAYLNGTRSQRMDTVLFARDILSLGVDQVAAKTVDELVTRILEGNLAKSSQDRILVPATGALMALSQDVSDLRPRVLEEVGEFVSSLGTRHDASKPAIAAILLEMLDNRASAAHYDRVLEMRWAPFAAA